MINKTSRTKQAEQNKQNKTSRTKQAEQNKQNKTSRGLLAFVVELIKLL